MSGLFFDAAFGLFGCAPVWLILLPAFLLLLARRSPLLLHMAVLSAPYLVIVVPRLEWYGGWSPPFRYALLAMPLLRHRPGAAAGGDPRAAGGPGAPRGLERADPGADPPLGGDAGLDLQLRRRPQLRARRAERPAGSGRRPLLPQLDPAADRHLGLAPAVDPARLAALVAAGPESRRPRRWPAGAPALTGIALMLAGAALLPAAAARVPTRVVEFEDPQVRKSGGHPHPDRWVVERTRYRGGWVLRVGEHLEAPVAPGGRRVKLRLFAELIRNQPVPYTLDIKEGGPAAGRLDARARAGLGDDRGRAGRLARRRAAGPRRARPGAARSAERGDPGQGGARVAVSRPAVSLSAVIPTLGRSPLLVPCLQALRREAGGDRRRRSGGDPLRPPRRARGPRPVPRAQPRLRGGDQPRDRRGARRVDRHGERRRARRARMGGGADRGARGGPAGGGGAGGQPPPRPARSSRTAAASPGTAGGRRSRSGTARPLRRRTRAYGRSSGRRRRRRSTVARRCGPSLPEARSSTSGSGPTTRTSTSPSACAPPAIARCSSRRRGSRHAGSLTGRTLSRERWRLIYGNRWRVARRYLGGGFWPRVPLLALRDGVDLARGRSCAARASWRRASSPAGGAPCGLPAVRDNLCPCRSPC